MTLPKTAIVVNLRQPNWKLTKVWSSLLYDWTDTSYSGRKDLIVKEQFIDSCPKDLAIHLQERAPETLVKIAKIADQYLEAHGKHLFSPASLKSTVQPERDEGKCTQLNPTALHCFKCNTRGHKAVNCPTMAKKCFL